MDKKLQISEQLLNATLQYLGRQPYMEVAQLVAAIGNECQHQPKEALADQPKEAPADVPPVPPLA